ncbi:glycosyltransferase [Rouxiella sp. WC2420]|uniref:Glycosyltransferase n=1 Tax=Rouxiella sp. WC2420 TaxID=3234145 RepID=A0AB39VTA1_9GAMM
MYKSSNLPVTNSVRELSKRFGQALCVNTIQSSVKPTNPASSRIIDKKIHLIWVGDDWQGLIKHKANIENTARKNPKYQVVIHIYIKSSAGSNFSDLKFAEKNIETVDMNNETWFSIYKKSKYFRQAEQSMNGERKNYASTSDILRKILIRNLGGIYSDADDIYTGSLPEKLIADPHEILTTKGTTFSRWGNVKGVHSSAFASHKDNNILIKIIKSSFEEFVKNEDIIYRKNSTTNHLDNNFRLNSGTAGSLHFSKFVMNQSEAFQKAYILSDQDPEHRLVKRHMPFASILKQVVTSGIGEFDKDQQLRMVEELAKSSGRIII